MLSQSDECDSPEYHPNSQFETINSDEDGLKTITKDDKVFLQSSTNGPMRLMLDHANVAYTEVVGDSGTV